MILADFNYLLMMTGILLIVIDILSDKHSGIDVLFMGIIIVSGSLTGIMFSSFSTSIITFLIFSAAYFLVGRGFLKKKLVRS